MKKIYLIASFLLLVAASAFAQKRTITGKVTSQGGDALQGVNILADKQKGGTQSDKEGNFSISVSKDATTLIFSSVGYTSQSVLLTDAATLNVTMATSVTVGEEVVVIGYGTQKRSQVTGAVTKFQNENLDEAPVTRVDQALQGKLAGVQIQNLSSEAGADPKVQVRGISSIGASASPLVVVDGHPVPDGLAFVNMADVQSVEVLKDAASAAIYGSRGANGVILITTKSGKSEKPKYTFKVSTGVKKAYKLYPLLTTSEYTNLLYYEASLRATDPDWRNGTTNNPLLITDPERAAYVIENTIRGGQGTDWQSLAIRDAQVRNIQLNVSGGSKTLKYYLSGGYNKEEGAIYHSDYNKYNVRAKLDATLSKRVSLTFNLNPSYISRERPSTTFTDFWRFQSYQPAYHDAATAAFVNQIPGTNVQPGDFSQARDFTGRIYAGYLPDGSYWNTGVPTTPFATANNTPKSALETRTINQNDYRVLSSIDLTIKILPGLNFKSLASVYSVYSKSLDYAERNSNRAGDVNIGTFVNNLYIDLLSENTLNYVKKIKKHDFSLLAGYTAQRTRTDNNQTVGLDFPSDKIRTLNTALTIQAPSVDANGNNQGTYSVKEQIGLISYLGRATYAYDNKYLLSASFRADGSSLFSRGNRYGYFPAVSAGWVASQESFIKNIKQINNLKFRFSYGAVGNNGIGVNTPYELLYPAPYSFGGGTGTVNSGQSLNKLRGANLDISWETTYSSNAGVDISLFKNRLNMSLDVYRGKTASDKNGLLLPQSQQLFTGIISAFNNIGRLQNDGIEFSVNTNNIRRGAVKWTTSANIAHTENKILAFGKEAFQLNQGERSEIYRSKVGEPIVQFFGYKTDGVWINQAQIDEARAKGLTSNIANFFTLGGLKLVDTNGDNTVNADDRIVTGSPYADFSWGVTNSFTYKNFDLSILVQGSQGGQLIAGDANYNETKRYNRNYVANRWISPNNPGDGKTPYSTTGVNTWLLTDYVVEDASYYAVREVVFGAKLPVKVAERVGANGIRLYFSAQNLYFHFAKDYKGINPEGRSKSSQYANPLLDGYQRGSFPVPQSFLVGIDLNF